MSELMEDLKPELYNWCAEEQHLDVQIADDEDFSKPHVWLRFLDDALKFNKWYAIELRHLEEEIDSHKVQHFVNTLPKGHTIVDKIMVSKVGFTQSAIVAAGQQGVHCINFVQEERTQYYGYLMPVIKAQTIDSPEVLSQREWQQIHDQLAESRQQHSTITATISDPQSEERYTLGTLEKALPIVTPYDTSGTYAYEFPKHRLLLTGFDPLPIERINFNYATTFQVLDGRTEAEALAEVLGRLILE